MGVPQDVSPYGSQTVTGPGWPNVDEQELESAAAEYSAWATKLTGSVVPLQQSQLTALAAKWTGASSVAAAGEGATIIAGHEANAAHAAAIALKLQTMAASVAKTKTLANATAEEVQQECMGYQAAAAITSNAQQLIEAAIKRGQSQNITYVNEGAAEVANSMGVPPSVPSPSAPPGTDQAAKAGEDGSKQAMQMLSQLGGMAAQLPGQLMQAPQQMMQQVTQPLQQITQLFGKGGSGSGAGAGKGLSPFSSFSNHPLAGGSGAGGGAGMVKAASLPGAGGSPPQTPMMSKLVGTTLGDVAVRPAGAGSTAMGGVAPVSSGAGGGMGMMPHGGRGEGGGTTASLAPPAPLEYDLGDEVDDDW